MKRLFLIIFLLLATSGLQAHDQALSVMSYNIRCGYCEQPDDINHWGKRKLLVAKLIRKNRPDLIGLQEAELFQVRDLAAMLGDYDWIGVGRDDGKDKGEANAILFRKSRYELLTQKTLWLSASPEQIGKGWDAALNRTVSIVRLRDRNNGREFLMLNTHFDHLGQQARVESSKLIVSLEKSLAGDLPVIVTGDLNLTKQNEAYPIIAAQLRDAERASTSRAQGGSVTFNDFGKSLSHNPQQDRLHLRHRLVRRRVAQDHNEAVSGSLSLRPLSGPGQAADALIGNEPVRIRSATVRIGVRPRVLGARADIRLPLLFSDGAVLQRDQPMRIWGDAIRASASTSSSTAPRPRPPRTTTATGWRSFPPCGRRAIWVAHRGRYADAHPARRAGRRCLAGSGQSNMELRVEQAANAATEIAAANDGEIRQFEVPNSWSAQPQRQLAGGSWVAASPRTVGGFSAVAYYFARDLHARTGVPIGIIDSSWGGTRDRGVDGRSASGTRCVDAGSADAARQQSDDERLLAADPRAPGCIGRYEPGDEAAWSARRLRRPAVADDPRAGALGRGRLFRHGRRRLVSHAIHPEHRAGSAGRDGFAGQGRRLRPDLGQRHAGRRHARQVGRPAHLCRAGIGAACRRERAGGARDRHRQRRRHPWRRR